MLRMDTDTYTLHSAEMVTLFMSGRLNVLSFDVCTDAQCIDTMHSGRIQAFLSNGCIGCFYLVKILANCAPTAQGCNVLAGISLHE